MASNKKTKPIVFQILSWGEGRDVEYDDETNKKCGEKYHIRIYGKTSDEQSVYVKINNFKPYFLIKHKETQKYSTKNVCNIVENIKNEVSEECNWGEYISEGLENAEIVSGCDLIGFTNYKKQKFIKLNFSNMSAYNQYKKVIKKKPEITIYESKIKPMFDFMHINEIKACGWVSVNNYKKITNRYNKTINDINVECDWHDVLNHESDEMAKFKIMSFDIECHKDSGEGFPSAKNDGDVITQIGSVFQKFGEKEPYKRHIITLKSCNKIKGMENDIIESYDTESQVLLAWRDLVIRENPDVFTGYNINIFDFKYMHDRAVKLNIHENFVMMNRHCDQKVKYIDGDDKKNNKMGSSKAFGDNILYYYDFEGCLLLDLFTYCKRNISLSSYKLDNVSSTYIRDEIYKLETINGKTLIKSKSAFGLVEDQYITISYFDGLMDNTIDDKYKISNISNGVVIKGDKEVECSEILIDGIIPEYVNDFKKLNWCHAKDDVGPKELFRLFRGDANDRGIIAKYCIMDCITVLKLADKLQVLNSGIAMANVCSVPLSYIFMRGQSIKAQSLVSRFCKKVNHFIPDIDPPENMDDNKEKYDGAIVFDPNVGIYDDPVGVLDFSSLYPSTAICYNISHETLIIDKQYDNIEGYKYHELTFNVSGKMETFRYAEKLDGSKGIIPQILDGLLSMRKKVKAEMEACEDPFFKKILDARQNAYKITANSIYGLLGAVVSPIYLMPLAPSITAGGRGMLEYSRKYINKTFNRLVNIALKCSIEKFMKVALPYFSKFPEKRFKNNNIEDFCKYFFEECNRILPGKSVFVDPTVIYGDTDSVFFIMKYTQEVENKLMKTIMLSKLAGESICKTLPEPQKQVYEKTMYPFIILAKKKYVGNLYEHDDKKFYQKNMGIVLKRRDNAKIVKLVVGGIVDYILNKHDFEGAFNYVRNILKKILRNGYPLHYFVISKTLKANYKNRKSQAHAYLADKIALRDPGNKPCVNDRVPFVYYVVDKKVKLQSERVEDPKYLVENGLKIDYLHYITNQIQKPSMQFLELLSDKANKVFENCIVAEQRKRSGRLHIKNYVYEKVEKSLSSPSEEETGKKITIKL